MISKRITLYLIGFLIVNVPFLMYKVKYHKAVAKHEAYVKQLTEAENERLKRDIEIVTDINTQLVVATERIHKAFNEHNRGLQDALDKIDTSCWARPFDDALQRELYKIQDAYRGSD